jgi:hypothetical protein
LVHVRGRNLLSVGLRAAEVEEPEQRRGEGERGADGARHVVAAEQRRG